MNHRWQQMVMIVTASLIIILITYDHIQQQKRLREQNSLLLTPLDIPDGFIWPEDILTYQKQIEEKEGEESERDYLLKKAEKYDLILDLKESLPQWRAQIEKKEKQSLIQKIQLDVSKAQIQSLFAPKTLQEAPQYWNFAIIGFEEIKVEDLSVMKYELTQASSWFLGHFQNPTLSCPFCAIEVSYEEARMLADRFSESTHRTPCYKNNIALDTCNGWRLPTVEEWKRVRGPKSQKWEYMIAPTNENGLSVTTGSYAPNVHEIHDIVGHLAEWTQDTSPIGSTFSGEVHQTAPIGVRFYRAHNLDLK